MRARSLTRLSAALAVLGLACLAEGFSGPQSNTPLPAQGAQCETLGLNLASVTAASGTVIESGTTTGVLGSKVTLGTSSFAYTSITFSVIDVGSFRGLVNLYATPPGGTAQIIVSQYPEAGSLEPGGPNREFPIRVAKGSILSAAWAANSSGSAEAESVILTGCNRLPAETSYSGVELATAIGASSIDCATTIQVSTTTFTSWMQLIAATAHQYVGLYPLFTTGGNTAGVNGQIYQLGYGASGSQVAIPGTKMLFLETAQFRTAPFYSANIPAGSALWMRGQSASAGTGYVMCPYVMGLYQ
jgi:hypothetical protein